MTETLLTGLEKAAVLLNSLSPQVTEKVLAQMPARQADQVRQEIAKISLHPDLSAATARVLEEAAAALASPPAVASPARPAAPPKLAAPTIDVRIDDTPEPANAPPVPPASSDPFQAIAALAPKVLAFALETENARTIALLMNRLDVEKAGQVYKLLSATKRKEVSLRFTDAMAISDDLLRHIALAVVNKCRDMGPAPAIETNAQADREKRMAGLLRGLERAERMETLAALEEVDPPLVARLKAMLYQFEDLLSVENTSIQKILAEVDMKTLAMALRESPAEIIDKITMNLSRRAQEALKEERELIGSASNAKIRQARQAIEEAMMRLDQRGELVMVEKA